MFHFASACVISENQSSLALLLCLSSGSSPWQSAVPWELICLSMSTADSAQGTKGAEWRGKKEEGQSRGMQGVSRKGGFQNITLFTVSLFILHFILPSVSPMHTNTGVPALLTVHNYSSQKTHNYSKTTPQFNSLNNNSNYFFSNHKSAVTFSLQLAAFGI